MFHLAEPKKTSRRCQTLPAWAVGSLLASLLWLAGPPRGQAQGLLLANPHWNITLTDFGYADYLLDNTPGFEGREYLSGEWGAAVAYRLGNGTQVGPQWLEPQFWYPDWLSNSRFEVASPLAQTGLNADGLPIAESVITNGEVEVTLRHEMLDTVVGIPMGAVAASGQGSGAFLKSDRYVLKQTCTIKNRLDAPLAGLQFFQLLHGYTSQRGVFDHRTYAGRLAEFHYDVTLAGVDPWSAGTNSSGEGLEDFIGFHSKVAPTAFEIGYYGVEGVDDHITGKPSDGVHMSIEDNWAHTPYSNRQGRDYFAPAERWVAGGQRWELGSLGPQQSVSFDILLSLLTGTKVGTTNRSGSCNGGSSVPGGVDYSFEEVSAEGSVFGEYSRADAAELAERIAENEFTAPSFATPDGPVQLWEVEFSGDYVGDVHLTFAYDPTLLPSGFDESLLRMYEFEGGAWRPLAGASDALRHTITVTPAAFGAFALGMSGGDAVSIAAGPVPVTGGTVGGAGVHALNSTVTLTATAAPGHVFDHWTEGGQVVSSSPSYVFTATADRVLQANFSMVGGGVTISAAPQPANGGTISGAGVYAVGQSVTVTATRNPGYKFSRWLENGVEVSVSSSYTFAASASRSLVAKFKPVYTMTLSASPATGGTVKSNDEFYEEGDTAFLTATPAAGYQFVSWTENGTPVSTAPMYQFTVTGQRTLVANFSSGVRISTAQEPLNAGATAGDGDYALGEQALVEAMPALGYLFVNWTEGGVEVSRDPAYSFTVDGSRTLVAHFAVAHTVVASPNVPAGGTTSGGGTFPAGTMVTVTATAASGYAFVNWTEGGAVVSSAASYSFTANANRTLVANFTPVYTITTTAAPGAGGTTSGGGSVTSGTAVTVTAMAASGYAFVNWTEGGAVVSTAASYSFTAGANRTLVANFTPVYTITTTAAPSAGGIVSGGGSVTSGTAVTVTAAAVSGYAFVNWTEGGAVVSTAASYSFTAGANRTLVANFTPVYTITTTAAPGAGGTTSGGGTYGSGSAVSVKATPAAGYTFVNWTEGGVVVSSLATYSFTAAANRNLVANFTAPPKLAIQGATATRSGTTITVSFVVYNSGGAATGVNIAARKDATLYGKTTTSIAPIAVGNVAAGATTSTVRLTFSGVTKGTRTLQIKFTFAGGTSTATASVAVP